MQIWPVTGPLSLVSFFLPELLHFHLHWLFGSLRPSNRILSLDVYRFCREVLWHLLLARCEIRRGGYLLEEVRTADGLDLGGEEGKGAAVWIAMLTGETITVNSLTITNRLQQHS